MRMNALSVLRVSAAILTGLLVTACDMRAPVRTIPAAIIVLPDAEDTKTSDNYDGQVSYRLKQPHPGERSIEEVRRRLIEQGWHRRERDVLNPENTFATTARWRTLETANGDVIAWSEQWENDDGDVVIYGFKYTVSAGEKPDARIPMEVLITHFRAETVKALEGEARQR
jgi:hypothetical protein